jgi:predicted transcriptional regulator
MEVLKIDSESDIRQFHSLDQKKVITLKEASSYSGIPMSTMYKHTHKRRFAFSKPTNKVIFIETESFLKWLLQNPQKTAAEMQSDALNFSKRKPKI